MATQSSGGFKAHHDHEQKLLTTRQKVTVDLYNHYKEPKVIWTTTCNTSKKDLRKMKAIYVTQWPVA